jgi:hypothetical protein
VVVLPRSLLIPPPPDQEDAGVDARGQAVETAASFSISIPLPERVKRPLS